MNALISRIFKGNQLKWYWGVVAEINALESSLEKLGGEELLRRSGELRNKATDETALSNLLPEAFALVREAGRRTLGQRHYDVQLVGGMALHDGKIAEMLTGEGKTLAATPAVYLNALTGKGVHVVTVNDYLAKRDTVWMGQIYHALGLRVACIVHDTSFMYDPNYEGSEYDAERDAVGSFKVVEKFLRPVTRKEAYEADITYGTNHEFGFDYLRDNLVIDLNRRVQRGHYYAIIDEVDSILIDEARTPLIISAPDEASSGYYRVFAGLVQELAAGEDYEVDEKLRTVSATDSGIEKVEKRLGVENIFAPENARLVHFLHESLRAKALHHRDKEYVVKNGEIIIVDEFTGRLLPGRRYSGGLHQAIEAKEGVRVQEENRTHATITIQNYFRMYSKIAGMTGTATTSAEEFHKVYNLDAVCIPPNKPMIRADLPDVIYKTRVARYKAVAEEVRRRHERGQPVLLGTSSIVNNEIISSFLTKAGVPHEILNAKNHEREGAIIAQAGRKGGVTVATNIAGRGVDIILGGNPPVPDEAEKVRGAGGLHVLGTERHESRRIDNQLRGRSGRQGDSGSSQFFLSLEDDLLRIFGGERIQKLMQMLNFPEDQPIESGIVSKAVNQAQARVEGANLDLRRHLLDFDDVLNKQREAIYRRRLQVLEAGEKNEILPIVKDILGAHVRLAEETRSRSAGNGVEESEDAGLTAFREKMESLPETIEELRARLIAQYLVRVLDALWIDHLEALESLRESVNIRAYGQHEPLVEYRREAHALYREMQGNFESLAAESVFKLLELDLTKTQAADSGRPVTPPELKKIGRNDPCWCGSGRKYKKCHGR